MVLTECFMGWSVSLLTKKRARGSGQVQEELALTYGLKPTPFRRLRGKKKLKRVLCAEFQSLAYSIHLFFPDPHPCQFTNRVVLLTQSFS